MEWSDRGIVLRLRRHGESSAVMSVLTREHGRHAGLVRGAEGRRARGALQPGNLVQLVWRGRLAEQLGRFSWDLIEPLGGIWLESPARLAAIAAACALAEAGLPEREIHTPAYEALAALLGALGQEGWESLYVHWELGLLSDLGFGLDLSACAATGSNDDLAFVSPRTGRAVSLSAGEPYRDRLLPLPEFLLRRGRGEAAAVQAGLALTGYFLERLVFGPLGLPLPAARVRLVERLRA